MGLLMFKPQLACRDVASTEDLGELLTSLSSLRKLPVEVLEVVRRYCGSFPIRGEYMFRMETQGVHQHRYSVAVDGSPSTGTMFVLDSMHYHRVQAFGLRNHDFKRSWGGVGEQPEQMNDPHGLCVDPMTNHLFIADTGNNRIQERTFDGELIRTFDADWISNPLAVTIDPHRRHLYISGAYFISVISLETGDRIRHFTFSDVWRVDSLFFDVFSGFLLAGQTHKHQIMVLNSQDGSLVRLLGGSGSLDHQLSYPKGVIVSAGEVLVADSHNKRVQVYSLDSGNHLHQIKHPNMMYPKCMFRDSETGFLYVIDGSEGSIFVFK